MVAGKSVSFTSTEDHQPRAEGSITQGGNAPAAGWTFPGGCDLTLSVRTAQDSWTS
jgi:hypothetical protein